MFCRRMGIRTSLAVPIDEISKSARNVFGRGKLMRVLVVGAGAVGGYFGARLAQAGRDITFLVRGERAKQLNTDGIRVVSPHGDLTMPVKVVLADQLKKPFDIIFLSMKGFALDQAMNDFAIAVGPNTTILPILNGMRHMETLSTRFGEEAVIGGVCMVSTEMDKDGRIVQLSEVQKLSYGELNRQITPRIEQTDEVFRGAGFDTQLSTDIVQGMWEKWVQLAAAGAITCLMRGDIGEVARAPGGIEFSRAILLECIAIATVCGHRPTPQFQQQQIATLTAEDSKFTTSLYRDLLRSNHIEVDAILGDLLKHAQAHSVEATLLRAAYTHLSVYENRKQQSPRGA
jgi:2-dehydropantoate 2-reductase